MDTRKKICIIENNPNNIKMLKNLNFKVINNEQTYDTIFNIYNNYIVIETNDLVKYDISKNFTFLNLENCYNFGKFDISL